MFFRMFPVLFGLIVAGGFSQFPEFAQQYTQRVGGAYYELRDVVTRFSEDAQSSGKTASEALQEYSSSDNQFFRDRGQSMQSTIEREDFLRRHYEALTRGDGFGQLVVFAKDHDLKLATDTLSAYRPAIPITFTGLAHAALGFLFGFLLLKLPSSLRRKRPRHA